MSALFLPEELICTVIAQLPHCGTMYQALNARLVNKMFDLEVCRVVFIRNRHLFHTRRYWGKGEVMSRRHLFLLVRAEMQLTFDPCPEQCNLHTFRNSLRTDNRSCYGPRKLQVYSNLRGAVKLMLQQQVLMVNANAICAAKLELDWVRSEIFTVQTASPPNLMASAVAAAMILCYGTNYTWMSIRTMRPMTQWRTPASHVLEAALLTATFLDDASAVRALLEMLKGEIEYYSTHARQVALYLACKLGYIGVARVLISYGARSTCDRSTWMIAGHHVTPLGAAVWWGHLDMVKFLLSSDCPGKRPDTASKCYLQLLSCMTWKSREVKDDDTTMLQYLLDNCTVQDIRKLKTDLLKGAGQGGSIFMVEFFLRQGLDPEDTIYEGLTPLLNAESCGHLNIVELLRRNKVKLGVNELGAQETRELDA